MRGPSPFLRLQTDEKLVQLTRKGNQAAYEALVSRYDARLIAFTRHMLGSREDAEDVTQETFAAAYNAMIADERPLNVKPWLYRIARNRSLNHLRRNTAIGVDDFDHHVADHGASTADQVHKREEFRQLMADVRELPETQRTALLLREMDALSYDQIAEAMETTVPSVKSLLVRARVGLAEAAEARKLTCEEVREELGEVAEGLKRLSPPVRRHLRECDRCSAFRASLKDTNKALALMLPIGPLLLLKKFALAHLGTTASAGGSAAVAGTATTAAGSAAGSAAGGALGAGVSAVASKAVATVAAAAIVTGGAAGVANVRTNHSNRAPAAVVAQNPAPAPAAPAPPAAPKAETVKPAEPTADKAEVEPQEPVAEIPAPPVVPVEPVVPVVPAPPVAPEVPSAPGDGTQEEVDEVELLPAPVEPVDPAPVPEPIEPPVGEIQPPPVVEPAPGTPQAPAPPEDLVLPPETSPAP